jgi:hypothetical protein
MLTELCRFRELCPENELNTFPIGLTETGFFCIRESNHHQTYSRRRAGRQGDQKASETSKASESNVKFGEFPFHDWLTGSRPGKEIAPNRVIEMATIL